MEGARRLETLERQYWEKHPRDLAQRLAPRRRYRDRCRKRLSMLGECVGRVIVGLVVSTAYVCCSIPNLCGEISPPATPRTPSPPLTPRMKPSQVSAMAPIPLERGQPRTLTLMRQSDPEGSFLPSQSDVRRGPHAQLTSPLLRLPREVRDVIWEMVLTDHVFHVGWSPKHLHHTVCSRCRFPDFCDGPADTCWPRSLEPSLHNRRKYAQDKAEPSMNLLGLAKTCKTIYTETIDLIYSRNVFSFNSWNCVRWFSEGALPSRRDLIRRV
ncbi:hypothetical protein B0J13DRAFT_552739 [Dactylonectria estremocensis]|uniref:DUF7730 domain-containing protein n=1 Tax=Dactylonectria estremocensis TaxID=1079267 RepID=A0A9P9EWY2_9HYPO|nr:hypothetical protein B0J13DRAFT_552739 [Dactylonectria estremocensis]